MAISLFSFFVLFCIYSIGKICQDFPSCISEKIFEYRELIKCPSLQCDEKFQEKYLLLLSPEVPLVVPAPE